MEIHLKKNELLAFAGTSQKLRVSCLTGTVWLTQQSDQNDHILLAGTSFSVNCKKMIVIVALTPSTATVSTATRKLDSGYVDNDFLYKIERPTPRRSWVWRRFNG